MRGERRYQAPIGVRDAGGMLAGMLAAAIIAPVIGCLAGMASPLRSIWHIWAVVLLVCTGAGLAAAARFAGIWLLPGPEDPRAPSLRARSLEPPARPGDDSKPRRRRLKLTRGGSARDRARRARSRDRRARAAGDRP